VGCGPLTIAGGDESATDPALGASDHRVTPPARAELRKSPCLISCFAPCAALDLRLNEELEQGHSVQTVFADVAQAPTENRRRDRRMTASEVDGRRGVDGGRLIPEALEQPLRLLDSTLGQAQFGQLPERLGVQRGLGRLSHLQSGQQLCLGLRPLAGRKQDVPVVRAADGVEVG
jgi:hypothetical protein